MYWRDNDGSWVNDADPAAGTGGWGTGGTSGTLIASHSGHYHFAVGRWNPGANVFVVNFGQDGTFAGNKTAGGNADDNDYGNFLYDVPAGFLSLCSKNLPDCTVIPSEHFNVKTYTQTGSTNDGDDVVVSTKACDLIWIKDRDSASYNHVWLDRIRGGDKYLAPNTAEMEGTMAGGTSAGITYGTDTYTIGNDANAKGINSNSGADYVAWSWRADGTTGLSSPDTEGTINATASSVNTDAGFSITQYSGNSTSGATIGHGLSVRPDLVLIKRLNGDNTKGWPVGSIQTLASVWPSFSHHMRFNTNVALAAEVAFFNDTNPTATVVSLGNGTWTNETGGVYMMYCWHNIDGYSKTGAYKGNYTADGAFVYLGFRPAYVIIKYIGTAMSWVIFDNKRSPYNDVSKFLFSDAATAETTQSPMINFLSNGMEMRRVGSYHNNTNPYLYMAFAETPFKNANAR